MAKSDSSGKESDYHIGPPHTAHSPFDDYHSIPNPPSETAGAAVFDDAGSHDNGARPGSSLEVLSHEEPPQILRSTRPSRWHQMISRFRYWWWLELIGACSSIALVTALYIIMSIYDGHTLEHWETHVHISPNTFVSTMITLEIAASMIAVISSISQLKWVHFKQQATDLNDLELYSQASRGITGAIIFALKPPFRSQGQILIIFSSASRFLKILARVIIG